MYGSLFWIEWLDRLDRILTSTREDVAALARAVSPRSVAAIELATRQLSALTNDLRLLDRRVLPSGTQQHVGMDQVENLQKALDTTLFHLGNLAEMQPVTASSARERALIAVDLALRDSAYEAALLLEPDRRRA
jgi:hypothetical protein